MNSKSITKLSDNELVKKAASGNAEAFSVLLKRYSNLIMLKAQSFGFTQGAEAQDFYQEGVIGFYSAIFSFDETKNKSFSNFAMLLAEQAMQRYYNSANRQKHAPLKDYVQIENLSGVESNSPSPEEILILQEQQNALFSSLSKLELSVAKLYLLGFSRTAIADKLELDVKKVDNAVQRIRQKIKQD